MWTSENRLKYNRDKLRYPSDLTDDEWSHIEPIIPPAKRGGRKSHTFSSARPQISASRMTKFLRVTPCAATDRGAAHRKDFGDAALGPESLGRPLAGLA